MNLTRDKDVRKLLKEAETHGWVFWRSARGHIKGRNESAGKIAAISGHVSDPNSLINMRKDLGLPRG